MNIIDNWPIKEWGHNSVSYIHHLSEAFRFAFADRAQYLGDPDYIHIPETELSSKEYGRQIASQIKPDSVLNVYPYGEFDEKENERQAKYQAFKNKRDEIKLDNFNSKLNKLKEEKKKQEDFLKKVEQSNVIINYIDGNLSSIVVRLATK